MLAVIQVLALVLLVVAHHKHQVLGVLVHSLEMVFPLVPVEDASLPVVAHLVVLLMVAVYHSLGDVPPAVVHHILVEARNLAVVDHSLAEDLMVVGHILVEARSLVVVVHNQDAAMGVLIHREDHLAKILAEDSASLCCHSLSCHFFQHLFYSSRHYLYFSCLLCFYLCFYRHLCLCLYHRAFSNLGRGCGFCTFV